jgi:acetyl esterase
MSLFFGATRLIRRPPKPPGPVREHAYGPDPAERLEIIEASTRSGTAARAGEAIVYIHGGGWIAGRKELYTRYLSFLAEAGYLVINVGYPLAPENPHPAILRSLLRAMDWIASNRSDVTAFHVMGDSAGGNLATMLGLLAVNPDLLGAVDSAREQPIELDCRSIVSLYGVLDRLTWIEDGFPGADTMLESYGGKDAFEAEVSEACALTPLDLDFQKVPPTLLAVGTKDPLRRSSQLFADRLAAMGADFVHKEYPGEGHGFFNLGLSKSDAQLREEILSFLAANALS